MTPCDSTFIFLCAMRRQTLSYLTECVNLDHLMKITCTIQLLNGQWETTNDPNFLSILSEILKAAIPGVSAGDTFGSAYFRGYSQDPFWLPCYVRRVDGNVTLIQKLMSAYAADGNLAAALSRTNYLYPVTYGGQVQYNIGMSEPPTRMPTLQPGGGGAGGPRAPSQAPASGTKSSVEFFLVSYAIQLNADADIP